MNVYFPSPVISSLTAIFIYNNIISKILNMHSYKCTNSKCAEVMKYYMPG